MFFRSLRLGGGNRGRYNRHDGRRGRRGTAFGQERGVPDNRTWTGH